MTIKRLMDEDAARDAAKPLHNLVLEFSDEEYLPVERAALQGRISIRDWAKKILNEAATMTDAEFFALFAPKEEAKIIPIGRPHIHAAAGSPIGADVEEWDGEDDTVLVRINGLSMHPLLNDQQIVSMHHKRAARSPFMKKGLIYLVEYDGGYTVKRYNTRLATAEEIGSEISYVSRADGKTKVHVLQSINPDFPEIVIKDAAEWVAWLDPKKDL